MASSMGSQYGIDVAYFQRRDLQEENGPDGDSWFLVQSKYGKAFAGTDTLLVESQKLIETLDGKRKNCRCRAVPRLSLGD
jgi:hypothetical protein